MIAIDCEGQGEGFLADDYVIKNICIFSQIFTKFWAYFVSDFHNFLRNRLHKFLKTMTKIFSACALLLNDKNITENSITQNSRNIFQDA